MGIKHREQCADSCPNCGIATYTRIEVDGLLLANRTALLAKLREGVEGQKQDYLANCRLMGTDMDNAFVETVVATYGLVLALLKAGE